MNRRDFIKQAAAAAAGIAVGATLPVVTSGFPGVTRVDVGNSEDWSAATVIWKEGERLHLESLNAPSSFYDFRHLAREWNLTLAQVAALPVEDTAVMGSYSFVRSVLEEAERQTSWGKVMQDIMKQELTQ